MKETFFNSWIAKLASLLIAVLIWLVIKSHLEEGNAGPPVPGTMPGTPSVNPVPVIEEIIISPLAPPPIPGNKPGS